MPSVPLPDPLDSDVTILGEPAVIYRDSLLTLQRHADSHAGLLAIQCFTAVLKEPITPASYAMLASVLTLHASIDATQVDSGDSMGGYLWLDFEAPGLLPAPRLAS